MRERLWRWPGGVALAVSVATLAGLGLASAAPAQASSSAPLGTASIGRPAGPAARPHPAPGRPADSPVSGKAAAWAAESRAAQAHYTNAACNTAPKPGRAQCFTVVHTAVKNKIVVDTSGPPPGALGPPDIQGAYDLPSATGGAGQTVAIVDAYGDSTAEPDLAAFRSHYGLPACTTANGCFKKVAQDGSTRYPADSGGLGGWALETSLDLDAVSSACPACHILLVEAYDNSFQNLGTAEDEAVALGAKFISNSWGACEQSGDLQAGRYFSHPGVAIAAASGDNGYDNTQEGCGAPSYPASSPYVTSVGGTTLTKDTAAPRGWDETVWADSGSGCSTVEPQPLYQRNIASITGACPDNRATNDLSADADPDTGLAVYDTLGTSGWLQVGGTSLAAPLVTAMYALAGAPAPGTNPVTYPYADPHQSADLNDITSGSNGSCSSDLCNAGPGWDGPTGLGTPHGVGALAAGPHGRITGRVTNRSTGKPVAGAAITAAGATTATATAGPAGRYQLTVPPGSYQLKVTAFGYRLATVPGVAVSAGRVTTERSRLASVPDQTLAGTVTDGSGQGWPLYARITISGDPAGPVYTSPYTGEYSVRLPQQATYHLHVAPVYPGYATKDVTVRIGTAPVVSDVAVPVGTATRTCTAPGYTTTYRGLHEDFDGPGWGGGLQRNGTADGWTDVDNIGTGDTWQFLTAQEDQNPEIWRLPPTMHNRMAIMDDTNWDNGDDTSLVSPVVDLSGQTAPVIAFDTVFFPYAGDTPAGSVDLSLDGGQTWSTVWSGNQDSGNRGYVQIPIPQAAGKPGVRVRFHYTGTGYAGQSAAASFWAVDNVRVGTKTCSPANAGLVAGVVTDGNTGKPVDGITVASVSDPSQSGLTGPSADPAFPGGFYWLASPADSTQLTASGGGYAPSTATVNVARGSVSKQNYALGAGRLRLSSRSVSVTEPAGASTARRLTFTNNGTQPVRVSVGQQDSGFTAATARASGRGARSPLIRGTFSPAAAALIAKTATGGRPVASRPPAPAGPGPLWHSIASYPIGIMDNAAGYDPGTGDVYSFGGWDGLRDQAAGYRYDPSAQQWARVASLPRPLDEPAGAFLDGRMYVAGGWDTAANAVSSVYAYNPVLNSWSKAASLPAAVSAAAATVLDGHLYVVGGCTTGTCDPTTSAVFRYDPVRGSWTRLAHYPAPVAFLACAGVSHEVVCAGGYDAISGTLSNSVYIYNPHTNSWSQGANMPYYNWGMAYTGSGNALLVAGGVTSTSSSPVDSGVTSQAYRYDLPSNTWTALLDANYPEYRGGAACGFYKIGGSLGSGLAPPQPFAEVLPGFSKCGQTKVPWLSLSHTTFTVQPGQSVAIAVTVHAPAAARPGTYTAYLPVSTNSPYPIRPVTVSMRVVP